VNILEFKGVSKTYSHEGKAIPAVGPLDLSLELGRTLAVVGPSGCGKSTLLLMMAGLERPSAGEALFKGEALVGPRREIALALQNYGLFPWKTVRRNVELGLKIRGDKADPGRVKALLTELGVADKMNLYPQQLSGGQRQRVALARALVLDPELLLLDEPFAAVDAITRERLQELVVSLKGARGFSMVLVTHNLEEAAALGHTVTVMGKAPGTVGAIIDNPQACNPDHRGSEEFRLVCSHIRNELEHDDGSS
jgi:ABC-type nitrate/sulfonate/bicarbonate transport system ATPase subunit